MSEIVTIQRIGHRGDGIAETDSGPLYIAHALAGETVEIQRAGKDRARLMRIIDASPERVAAFIPGGTACGACGLSHMSVSAQLAWKRDLVSLALQAENLAAEIGPCIDANGAGRRRATFHVRWGEAGPRVGFMEARSHDLVDLEVHTCPALPRTLQETTPLLRSIASRALHGHTSMDALVTGTTAGLDIDLRGLGPLDEPTRAALIDIARRADLARLSLHGAMLVEIRPPIIRMGQANVHLPPGSFLQPTEAGESVLSRLVLEGAQGARHTADLFAGVGTFALRLAERASVYAAESERAAIEALSNAARATPALRPVQVETRDLMRRPLAEEELARFDAVVFDPPRAGAEAQAHTLAASQVPKIVAVSCSPSTLGRDLSILVAGGYRIASITPVDQFRHSAHVEAVAVLEKEKAPPRRRRVRLD